MCSCRCCTDRPAEYRLPSVRRLARRQPVHQQCDPGEQSQSEPAAKLQTLAQRDHVSPTSHDNRDRDKDTHQRLTGDQPGREKRAFLMDSFARAVVRERRKVAFDQVGDESAGEDEGSFQGSKVFSYTGAVMTLPTGVQAVAENNYGRPDQALDYLKRMTRSFSYALPGSMYEVSPDYGMMAQAWNIYAFAVPVVRQFFGIDPMASGKEVRIHPRMPGSWDHASLEDVLIGDNRISIHYQKDGSLITLRVLQQQDWKLQIALDGTTASEVTVLQGSAELTPGEDCLLLTGTSGEFRIQYSTE